MKGFGNGLCPAMIGLRKIFCHALHELDEDDVNITNIWMYYSNNVIDPYFYLYSYKIFKQLFVGFSLSFCFTFCFSSTCPSLPLKPSFYFTLYFLFASFSISSPLSYSFTFSVPSLIKTMSWFQKLFFSLFPPIMSSFDEYLLSINSLNKPAYALKYITCTLYLWKIAEHTLNMNLCKECHPHAN